MSARSQKRPFGGSPRCISGRSSALGVEAQDTRYYSTPATGPSRARSADSRSCSVVKFGSLNVDWERMRYLEQRRPNAAHDNGERALQRHGEAATLAGSRDKSFYSRKQRSTHAHRLACCSSGHCATCSNAMHSADWSRQIALLSLHDSALQRRAAERQRRSELARQLLDRRTVLSQVDAALQQAGQLCRPEQLAPLLSTPPSRVPETTVAPMSTTRLECPASAKVFGQARKFVPSVGGRVRTQRAVLATGQQEQPSRSSSGGAESAAEIRANSRHINDIFRIPYEDSGAVGIGAAAAMEDQQRDQQKVDEDDAAEDAATTAKFLQQRRRAGRSGVVAVNQDLPAGGGGAEKAAWHPLPLGPMSVTGRQAQLARRMSTVEMVVHNEEGEAEEVEIDVADAETEASASSQRSGSSISDRINRRRNSELAADIIRVSAAHRRREFVQLLDEHRAIVRQLKTGGGGSGGRRSNQRPPPLSGAIQEGSVDDKDRENF